MPALIKVAPEKGVGLAEQRRRIEEGGARLERRVRHVRALVGGGAANVECLPRAHADHGHVEACCSERAMFHEEVGCRYALRGRQVRSAMESDRTPPRRQAS